MAGLVALALATLGILIAAPVYASSVSNVTFTPGNLASGATSTWTVAFKTTSALTKNQDLTINFVSGFGISASPTATFDAAFASANCTPKIPSVSGQSVTVGLAGGQCAIAAGTTLSVQIGSITNPSPSTATSYGPANFTVSTTPDATPQAATSAVTIAPGKLAFTTSPSASTAAGTAFANQPVVTIQDSNNKTVTSSSAAVTVAVTGGGATISCTTNPVAASSGVATFTGCKMTKAGTYTLAATSPGLTAGTSSQFAVTVASGGQLSFVQGPTDAFAGTAMAQPITVQASDPFGNSLSNVSVTLVPSAGAIASGASATTNTSGVASFSGLTINGTGLGLSLTASASGLTSSGASNTFNVTVQVNGSANALTDTATDAGSGTQSVSYYYCSGYPNAPACTAATGTLIGTSFNAGSSFPVSWTTRPANGAYRVIAVGTDNVGNISSASGSTPVTVTG